MHNALARWNATMTVAELMFATIAAAAGHWTDAAWFVVLAAASAFLTVRDFKRAAEPPPE